MQKSLLLLLCFLGIAAALQAQCMRDSSIYQTTTLLSPATYTPAAPSYNLAVACIDHSYTQSITINVPASYMNIPISSVQIAQTGAVSGLPNGLTYSCDPPNCTFAANSLGCVLVSGTPTVVNTAPDTTDLGIMVRVNSAVGMINLTFPMNDEHYYLILQTAACASGLHELDGQLASVRNVPNPFSSLTQIEVGSYQSGDFRFEVFDLLGQRVYADPIHLEEGLNQFAFDAGYLANGSYFYTISNASGKVSRLMVVAR